MLIPNLLIRKLTLPRSWRPTYGQGVLDLLSLDLLLVLKGLIFKEFYLRGLRHMGTYKKLSKITCVLRIPCISLASMTQILSKTQCLVTLCSYTLRNPP